MPHVCSPNCDCKIKLDAAMAAIQESSRLLSASVFSGPDEQIEKCFASFRIAKTALFEAIDYYKSHLTNSPPKMA
jgi:hypothetical protein